MTTVQQVYDHLDQLAPFGTEEPWDNCGLLVGDPRQVVDRVLVALDVTDNVLREAIAGKYPLIVTHHPVIFSPLKRLPSDLLVYQLAQAGIAVISAHTNLDKAPQGVNYHLARTLGLQNVRPFGPTQETKVGVASLGRMGEIAPPCTVAELASRAKDRLGCGAVQLVECPQSVETVAVVGGSGGDCLQEAKARGADCLVTADVKHSQFLEAAHLGMGLLDAGHYCTEQVVLEPLARHLRTLVPDTQVAQANREPYGWL